MQCHRLSKQVRPYNISYLPNHITDGDTILYEEALQISRLNLEHNQRLPIAAFPAEILSEIFEIAGQGDDFIDTIDPSPIPPFPIVASHVMSRWRETAIHTPIIWTNINISPYLSLDALVAYLKRSKNYPLNVVFNHPADQGRRVAYKRSEMTAVMACYTMIPHFRRCQNLLIKTSPSVINTLLPLVTHIAVPLLRRLSISTWMGKDDKILPPAFDRSPIFLGGTPLLSLVCLSGSAMASCCPILLFVTSLHLHQTNTTGSISMYWSHLRNILIAAPSLTRLSISGDIVDYDSEATCERIRVPSLRFLWFQFIGQNSSDPTIELIDLIEAPNLESLTLCYAYDTDITNLMPEDFDQIDFDFDFPALRSLTLAADELDVDSIRYLALMCPTITHLRIIRDDTTEHGLGVYRYLSGSHASLPWPDLTVVESVGLMDHEMYVMLLALVGIRASRGHPLQTLRVGPDRIQDFAHLRGALNIETCGLESAQGRWWSRVDIEPAWMGGSPLTLCDPIYPA